MTNKNQCFKCKKEAFLYSTSDSKISPMQSVALCDDCFEQETGEKVTKRNYGTAREEGKGKLVKDTF